VEQDSCRAWKRHKQGKLSKKNPANESQNGDKDWQGEAQDIAKKRRHMDFGGFGDRLDHEVGAITDVGGGPKKDGA
jgi:hypothetical protein